MRELNLEAIREFHTILRCVAEAGLGREVFGRSSSTEGQFERQLLQVEDRCNLAIRAVEPSQQAAALQKSLSSETLTQGKYIQNLMVWLKTGGSTLVIESDVDESLSRERSFRRARLQAFYVALWFCLAALVFVFICYMLAPHFLALASQLRHESVIFNSIGFVREWGFLAVPLLLFVGAAICWMIFRSPWRSARLEHSRTLSRKSTQAALAAELLESGPNVDDADNLLSDKDDLMTWAMLPSDGVGSRVEKLRFASEVYRAVRSLQDSQDASLTPSRWTILAGGVLVFVVSALVFVPIVELLMMVIRTEGGGS